MPFTPLTIALEPIVPARKPTLGSRTLDYGFRLRIPNGGLIEEDDALLSAFAMTSVTLDESDGSDEDTLQHEHFEPGVRLVAVLEPLDEDGDDVVGVWDHERIRRAGQLCPQDASRVAAASDHQLPIELIAVSERRTVLDNRRVALDVLIYSPHLVRIKNPPSQIKPPASARPRVVLFADGPSELRWWDPSANGGPAAADDLPVSEDLRGELARISVGFREVGDELCPCGCGCPSPERQALDREAEALWRRVRSELGRDYAVGFLGPGMTKPRWAPDSEPNPYDIDD